MAKNDLRRARLKPNNGSIVIYYSKAGIMRFPTGITISKAKDKKGNFKEWDYKDATIRSTVSDYEARKERLDYWFDRANKILSDHFKEDHFLTAPELERLLSDQDKTNEITRSARLVEMYEQFWVKKENYFKSKKTIISLKDYTSFKNMLYDFEAVRGMSYKIKDVDNMFLEDFLNWMRTAQPKKVGEHTLKSKGNLNAKTCKKRFDILLQFWRFLETNKIVADVKFISDFAKKEIRVVRGDKVSLTVDEVHLLYKYNFGSDKLNNIRDLFVFACFCGMRWSDLEDFDNRFIQPSSDKKGFIYKKRANKTRHSSGVSLNIPLADIVLEILKRHNNSLKPILINNVNANLYIKEACKITGYFDQITEIRDKVTNEYLRRYEAITMHKARDTFISNLVSTTPLNELMLYTGHKKLSTLQIYIDGTRDVSMDYIKIFNRKPNE